MQKTQAVRLGVERFLAANGDPALNDFTKVAGTLISRRRKDCDPDAADDGWRNGAWRRPRYIGAAAVGRIPTVTVPLGILRDIDVPVDMTFGPRFRIPSNSLPAGAAPLDNAAA